MCRAAGLSRAAGRRRGYLLALRRFAELDGEFARAAVAPYRHLRRLARLGRRDDAAQGARGIDVLTVEFGDDVSRLQTGFGSRAVREHLGDQGAARVVEVQRLRELVVEALDLHAEPAALDGAVLAKIRDYFLRLIRGDREADADVAAVR